MNEPLIAAVLFDLDGTLLDTAEDLTTALNQVLVQHQKPTVRVEAVRPYIALGSAEILRRGFTIKTEDPHYSSLRQEFLNAYSQHLTETTRLFDGMNEVLEYLDKNTIPWGIVTNKPGWLSERLLQHFKLEHRSRCLIAGDTLPQRKPHPMPLLEACRVLAVNPRFAAYVGDAETDVQAAKAAGMTAVVAEYGYLQPHSHPRQWGADIVIEQPQALTVWLCKNRNSPHNLPFD